jgi:hypothetical protein
LFREDGINSTQRLPNPCCSYQLVIGGKYYPNMHYNTFDDPRTLNQTNDALNINNSNFCSISKDLLTSMFPWTNHTLYSANGVPTESKHFTTGNHSNYFTGFPFCDSEVFQGGITSQGTI